MRLTHKGQYGGELVENTYETVVILKQVYVSTSIIRKDLHDKEKKGDELRNGHQWFREQPESSWLRFWAELLVKANQPVADCGVYLTGGRLRS